jgi:hypothetical protein
MPPPTIDAHQSHPLLSPTRIQGLIPSNACARCSICLCFPLHFVLSFLIRFLNAAKAFKMHCRQSQLIDELHASDLQTNDATSALRSGLSSSKKPVILTERVPTSLLPSASDPVQAAAASAAAALAAEPVAGSRATVSCCMRSKACH